MKLLSAAEVVRRMKSGDLPYPSPYAGYVIFADGAKAKSYTMVRLLHEGKVKRPEHTSVYSPWRLGDTP